MRKYIAIVIWFVLALLGFAFTVSNANACKSWIVGALASSQCTEWTFWHTISGYCMAAAVITFVVMIAVDRSKNAN